MQQIITRHRHELRRRVLRVVAVQDITPAMRRISFQSAELADFVSLAPDDHIKIMLPDGADGQVMREYTPRHFDTATGTIEIDFALHEAGPATRWALEAVPGSELQIGGPRGSQVVNPIFDWWLLIGDETALPAIGRWVEEMAPQTRVQTLGLVRDAQEEQQWQSAADLRSLWVHRPASQAGNSAPLLAALRDIELPEGQGFIWIGAEAGVARAARDYLTGTRGHPLTQMKAAGYWTQGQADSADKTLA